MKQLLAVLLCVSIPFTLFASDVNYKVIYDGGSLPDLKTGSGLHMYITQDKIRFMEKDKEIASIPTFPSPKLPTDKMFTAE